MERPGEEESGRGDKLGVAMAESLPVVTLPGEEEGGESSDIAPEDIVVLHEVVVEELPVVEGTEVDAAGESVPLGFVTEPAEDVIALGDEEDEDEIEDEDEEEVVVRVASGPPRGGMATDAGIHPTTVPTSLPVEDVPPDETIPVDDLADKSIAEGGDEEEMGDGEVKDGGEDEGKVVSEVVEEKVTVVEEKVTVVEEKVTVVEEVVETVEEVVEATGEVVGKTVTDTVKVDEVVTVSETVTEVDDAMETEGEKAEKKRLREGEGEGEDDTAVKKLKPEGKEEEEKVVEPRKFGPKVFKDGIEMFTYFYNLLHDWNLNLNVNKYEFMVLTDLINQGNPQKAGDGIAAFQVRMHQQWNSRCYYLIRKDGSEDDFSYRKLCDALMPLPKSLYRNNGEINLEKLFPGQKGRHFKEQNGGGRGGGRGDRGGRGGGGRGHHGGHHGGRGGGGGGGRGGRGGGRRGGRGRW